MIVVVGTVRDTLENVQRFVRGNLAHGAHHVVVALDDPHDPSQAEPLAWLDGHPAATAVACDADWWHGRRPQSLNARQRLNANAIKAALTATPGDHWLLHLDGDEIALLDGDRLAQVPGGGSSVRLRPMEVVAGRQPTSPPLFKRFPSPDELALAYAVGAIREPTRQTYFRGHLLGKVGIRPALNRWLSIHYARGADGERLDEHSATDLHHLHFESSSPAEFRRKWEALLTSGTEPNARGPRRTLQRAIRAVGSAELDPDIRAWAIDRIFDRLVADHHVDELQRLGLVVPVDPFAGSVTRSGGVASADELAARIGDVASAPKQIFATPERLPQARRWLEGLAPYPRGESSV